MNNFTKRFYIKELLISGGLLLTVLCKLIVAKGVGMFSHVELGRLVETFSVLKQALIVIALYYLMNELVNRSWNTKSYILIYLAIISVTIPIALISMAIDIRTINLANGIKSIFPFAFRNYLYVGVFFLGILTIPFLKKLIPATNGKMQFRVSTLSLAIGLISGVLLLNRPSISFLVWTIVACVSSLSLVKYDNQKRVLGIIAVIGFISLITIDTFSTIRFRISLTNNIMPFFALLFVKSTQRDDENIKKGAGIQGMILLPIILIFSNPLLLELCRNFFVGYFQTTTFGWLLFIGISAVIFVFVFSYSLSIERFVNSNIDGKQSVAGTVPLIISSVTLMYMLYNYSEFQALGFDAMIKQQNGRIYLAFLNLLIVVLWYLVVSTIINRFWISTTLFSVVMIGFSFANVQKIQYRNEPIIYPDLAMVKSLPEIIKMVNVQLIIGMLVGVVVLLIVAVILQRKIFKGKLFRIVPRIMTLL